MTIVLAEVGDGDGGIQPGDPYTIVTDGAPIKGIWGEGDDSPARQRRLDAHERERRRLWCDAWTRTASANNCLKTATCTQYADAALAAFDARFARP